MQLVLEAAALVAGVYFSSWIVFIVGIGALLYQYRPKIRSAPPSIAQFCIPFRYQAPDKHVMTSNRPLNDSMRNLINNVVKAYVSGWCGQISPHNSSFSDHVDLALATTLSNVLCLFDEAIDWPQFLVGKVLPVLTTHMQTYSRANIELQRSSQIHRLSETDALQNKIALFYDRLSSLHPNVNNVEPHLEALARILTPMLVPSDLVEYTPSLNFINSLLGNAILKPLLNLLVNPDFLNQQVVKAVEKMLQDSAKVTRLRQIVQLTLASQLPPLTPQTDQEGYLEFLAAVQKLESVALARQAHYSVSLLLQRLQHSNVTSPELQLYLHRLVTAKDSLEEQLKQLDPHSINPDDLFASFDFNSVLSDTRCLPLFEEFIRCQDVNYWHVYTQINSLDTSSVDPLGGFQMESTPLSPLSERKIVDIYNLLLNISKELGPGDLDPFEDFVNDPSHEKYVEVQRVSWKIRRYLVEKLESFIPEFKKSVYFEQFMALAGDDRTASVDRLQTDDINTHDEINHEVIQDAVMDAIGEDPVANIQDEGTFAGEIQMLLGSDLQDFRPRIERLSKQIAELESQVSLIQPLLNKAELTNDVTELNILRKSTDSLRREINRKVLVKDQLLIRSNQTSFYKNFDISIVGNTQSTGGSGEFTSYCIRVKNIKSGDEWTISRRYKQFYALHKILRSDFDRVYEFPFPKKKMVLKFQQRQFIEVRQAELNTYLGLLVNSSDICEHLALQMFMTSESFPGNYFDCAANLPKLKIEHDNDDDRGFAQPIAEAFLTMFNIDEKTDWIRGKAIVIVIQQILGGTIEKRIRELGDSLPKHVPGLFDIAVENIWPEIPRGVVQRTLAERIHSRDYAQLLLKRILNSWLQRVVGASKCNFAAETCLGMLQNTTLNRHLVLTLLDLVVDLLGSPTQKRYSPPTTPVH